MNINRMLLLYTALVATGILFVSARNSFAPDPTNKLVFDIAQIKENVNKINTEATSESRLTGEINSLKTQIAQQSQDYIPQSAGAPMEEVLGKSSASGQGYVKVAENYSTLDVYEDTSFSSSVIGKIEPEKSYPYIKKQNNWLLVKIDKENEGWVNSKLVEVTNSKPNEAN